MQSHESDHDRLVRIETVLTHLTEKLEIHIHDLRMHVRDKSNDINNIKEILTKHLTESEAIRDDVKSLKSDVRALKSERMKIAGWVTGVVFAAGAFWAVVEAWVSHFPKVK